MPNAVSQATFDSVAAELLASAADLLAAERRSYAAIEEAYNGAFSDTRTNLLGVANSLDALAAELRS